MTSSQHALASITAHARPQHQDRHHPVERWVKPEEFVEHYKTAAENGFAGVMAGPLVRSSYRFGRLYAQAMSHHRGELPAGQEHLTESGDASQEAGSVMARLAR